MTWKAALLTALKGRSRRDFFRAVFIATPAAVIYSFQGGPGAGLILGAWIGGMTFLADVVDDARKARKSARREASRVPD